MSGFLNLNGFDIRPGFTSLSGKDHLAGFTNKPNASSTPPAFSPDQISNLLAWWPVTSDYTNVKQAASFTAASSEYLVKATPGWNVGVNDDYWGSAWVSITNKTASRVFISKANTNVARQFFVFYDNPSDRFIFNFGNSGSVVGVTANNFGAVPGSTTCHVFWYHDAATNTLGIQVNGGTANTQTYVDGAIVVNASVDLVLGGFYSSGTSNFWNGTIDAVTIGKNPPGGIESVRSALVSALYNAGAGLQPSLLTSAQRTDWGVVAGYDLDEYSAGSGAVTRNDAIGSDHLTDTNTVPSATGLLTGDVSDNDPVFQLDDRSGNSYHLAQSTNSLQPIWDTNDRTTLPAVKFDGVDDIIAAANSGVLDFERTDAFSISMWVYTSSNAHPIVYPLISKIESAGNLTGWGVFLRGSTAVPPESAITFILRNTNGTNYIKVDTPDSSLPAAGAYWHLAVTYSGSSAASGVSIYINGVSQTLTTVADTLTATTLNAINMNLNGRNGSAVTASANRYGATLLYGKALSQAEVSLLYANT